MKSAGLQIDKNETRFQFTLLPGTEKICASRVAGEARVKISDDVNMQRAEANAYRVRSLSLPRTDVHDLGAEESEAVTVQIRHDRRQGKVGFRLFDRSKDKITTWRVRRQFIRHAALVLLVLRQGITMYSAEITSPDAQQPMRP